MKPVKVLIVDDSVLIHKFLNRIFSDGPNFQVVACAGNGKVALEAISQHDPDVVTLDIQMPEMDGLETLSRIMKESPRPVVMLSSFSREGAELTFNALDMGAVDFITKPHPVFSRSILDIQDEILLKVETASKVKVRGIDSVTTLKSRKKDSKKKKESGKIEKWRFQMCRNIVTMGVSTGGPKALQTILPTIPEDIPAGILIVQHMPVGFTRAFADRLDRLSNVTVKEAEEGDPILPGVVYIARGDHHLMLKKHQNAFAAVLNGTSTLSKFRPSVDVTMESAAEHFQENTIGVIMTGMCNDGVEGVKRIKENGGRIIAQDKKSSVVFGMNRLAIESGCVDRVVPLENVVPSILDILNI